jgi:hypothetical protein
VILCKLCAFVGVCGRLRWSLTNRGLTEEILETGICGGS